MFTFRVFFRSEFAHTWVLKLAPSRYTTHPGQRGEAEDLPLASVAPARTVLHRTAGCQGIHGYEIMTALAFMCRTGAFAPLLSQEENRKRRSAQVLCKLLRDAVRKRHVCNRAHTHTHTHTHNLGTDGSDLCLPQVLFGGLTRWRNVSYCKRCQKFSF